MKFMKMNLVKKANLQLAMKKHVLRKADYQRFPGAGGVGVAEGMATSLT